MKRNVQVNKFGKRITHCVCGEREREYERQKDSKKERKFNIDEHISTVTTVENK